MTKWLGLCLLLGLLTSPSYAQKGGLVGIDETSENKEMEKKMENFQKQIQALQAKHKQEKSNSGTAAEETMTAEQQQQMQKQLGDLQKSLSAQEKALKELEEQ
jgi:hypothetical protein